MLYRNHVFFAVVEVLETYLIYCGYTPMFLLMLTLEIKVKVFKIELL